MQKRKKNIVIGTLKAKTDRSFFLPSKRPQKFVTQISLTGDEFKENSRVRYFQFIFSMNI